MHDVFINFCVEPKIVQFGFGGHLELIKNRAI